MNRLDLIRTMHCCQCGYKPPSQAAHSNWQEHGKGKGIKADDYYTIPLCDLCHKQFDQYSDLDRAKAKQWFKEKHAFVNEAMYGKRANPVF